MTGLRQLVEDWRKPVYLDGDYGQGVANAQESCADSLQDVIDAKGDVVLPRELALEIQNDLRRMADVQEALGWETYAAGLRSRANLIGMACNPS